MKGNGLGHFGEMLRFPGSSYTRSTHVTKLLLVFLPFVRFAYYRGISVKNLEG